MNRTLWTGLFLSVMCSATYAADSFATADAHLNEIYRQRVAQLQKDQDALTALRSDERDWIKERDQQCGKDDECLTSVTVARADYLEKQVAQGDPASKGTTSIPSELQGTWTIHKTLPTDTISCWDDKQANRLIGTKITYQADSFHWGSIAALRSLRVTTNLVNAKQFAEDHSGSSSSVDFATLGIKTPSVKEVSIEHADITIKDGSPNGNNEVPGENVLLKDADTLVFSVCNVYFEAKRDAVPHH